MAIFNLDKIGNINQAKDLQQIKSYLYRLQEELTYMFNNLTPDDNNATSVPKISYSTDGDKYGKIEVTVDGISIEVGGVSEEDLISTINSRINVNHESIQVTTGALIIDANQFKLDASGNAQFYGYINANNNFIVDTDGNCTAKSITIGTVSQGATGYFGNLIAGAIGTESIAVNYIAPQSASAVMFKEGYSGAYHNIDCYDVIFHNQYFDPYRWTMGDWLQWLYDNMG